MNMWNVLRLCVQALFQVALGFSEITSRAQDFAHDSVQFWIIGIFFKCSLCLVKRLIGLTVGQQSQRQAEQSAGVIRLECQSLPILLFGLGKRLALAINVSKQDMQFRRTGIEFTCVRQSSCCKMLG